MANLVAVDKATHELINNEWTQFRTMLNGRIPSPAEVMKNALEIDELLGGRMRFSR
jgi:hypothetical protein